MVKAFTFPLESNLNRDKNRSTLSVGGFWEIDAPTGIRTPVVALKGLRPSPLDDGGNLLALRGVRTGAKAPRSRSVSGRILSSPIAMVKHFVYFC